MFGPRGGGRRGITRYRLELGAGEAHLPVILKQNRRSSLPRYALTALIVACALLMENLDGTVISTSLPAIARDLHEDPLSLKLALTSYLIALWRC